MSSRSTRFVALADRLQREHPDVVDPVESIQAGHVLVDGVVTTNPRSLVRRQSLIAVKVARPLRGAMKLRAALTTFDVSPHGHIALDVGASTGGFTSVLVEAGARRVYAVDAGFGQLLGSLRQCERVVNLERTNVGALTSAAIHETIDLVTIDLSYLALAEAVPQLEGVSFAPTAFLIALVKPMYELGLSIPPTDGSVLEQALAHASRGIEAAPWTVCQRMRSPITGNRGAVEFLLYARRR